MYVVDWYDTRDMIIKPLSSKYDNSTPNKTLFITLQVRKIFFNQNKQLFKTYLQKRKNSSKRHK